MPMGIVNDEDFEKEVNRSPTPIVLPRTSIEQMERPGRTKGDNNVPNSLRKIIGETHEIDGRQSALELAAQFGISPSSVSAYGNGSTSTASYDKPSESITNHITKVKEKISRKARSKLFKSLHYITDEKLENAKPEVLANVARSMSAIVKEMEPDTPKDSNTDGKSGPTFLVYSPQIRDERHYEMIVAKE